MSSPRLAWSSVYTPSHAVRDSAAGPCARSRPNREASAARTRMAATFFIFTWSWPSGRWNIRAAARSFPRRWQRVSNVLTGVRPAADGNYDVLLAMHHVGHRRTGLRRRHIHRADFFAGGFIVGAQHGPARMIRGCRHMPFARDDQRLGLQSADVEGLLAGARNVQAFERLVVAHHVRRLAMCDLPDEFTFIQIDGRNCSVRRLNQRQTV